MRTAKTHRKFAIYSTFLDTILEGEEEIQEGETRKEVLKRINKELEETAAELRKEAESMRGQIISETIQGAKSNIRDLMERVSPPIEINRKHELLIDLINDCQTIEQLQEWKEAYPVVPPPVSQHYDNKLKQLSNGDKE